MVADRRVQDCGGAAVAVAEAEEAVGRRRGRQHQRMRERQAVGSRDVVLQSDRARQGIGCVRLVLRAGPQRDSRWPRSMAEAGHRTRRTTGSRSRRAPSGPRGRVFLPTETPDDLGYYTRPVDILEDTGGGRLKWTWKEWRGPAYVPRACPVVGVESSARRTVRRALVFLLKGSWVP